MLYLIYFMVIMLQSSHNYTRKELATWVQSYTKYKYEELRNGVFFCKMLTIKYPDQATKIKYNQTPISEYDYTSNLNAMKKILNKKGLQQNLNVSIVLQSKNNFELAKWFKALMDSNICAVDNFSSVQVRENIDKIQLDRKITETPRRKLEASNDKNKIKMQSAQKPNKNSQSKAKRLSMAKSEAYFFQQKKMMKTQLKLPMPTRERKQQKEGTKKFYETDIFLKSYNDQDGDDMKQILYQRALEESIDSFTLILQRIKKGANSEDCLTFHQYRQALKKCIFNR